MGSSRLIQRPSIIAQIPHPLDPQRGNTYTNDVHNLVNSRKRKLSELTVAVDGESVNIYDVKANSLVTTYPVPPQSSFACAPCSIRTKTSRSSPVLRKTFCALQTPETEIVLFSEQRHGNSISDSKKSYKISSSELAPHSSPSTQIVSLDVIPIRAHAVQDTNPHIENDVDLICVHEDGQVRRFAGDLQGELWSVNPFPARTDNSLADKHSVSVRGTFLVDLDIARRSILKRREDVLASLTGGSDSEVFKDFSVLIIVSHPAKYQKTQAQDVSVDFFAVPWDRRSPTLFSNTGHNILHLMTKTLPQLLLNRALQLRFHALSGALYVAVGSKLLTFDLCEHIPKIASPLQIDNENIDSYLRVSSSSAVVSTNQSVTVYNLQYQSIQASLQQGEMLPKLSRKKHQSSTPPLRFVSHYPKLNVAVALHGNTLVGFQLSTTGTKRGVDGLLIDSIGRGIRAPHKQARPQKLGGNLRLVSMQEDSEWKSRRAELDGYVLSRDVQKFEECIVSELCRRSGKKPKKAKAITGEHSDLKEATMENGLIDQVEETKLLRDSQNLKARCPPLSSTDYVDQETLCYLLSKIFSWEKSPNTSSVPDRLVVSFFPSELFRWLVETGRLSSASVEVALRKQTKELSLLELPSGSIVRALSEFDPSLHWLIFTLQEFSPFTTSELVLSLKLLLQYDSQGEDEEPRLLTNGSHDATSSQKLPTPKPELSQTSKTDTKSAPSPSLLHVTTALNLALSNLHTHHPARTITTSLRTHLTRSETFTIIHHLRLCLASGGWTSRFIDHHQISIPDPSAPNEPPTLSLSTITYLLNCAVDTIGVSGFLSAVSTTSRSRTSFSPTDPNSMDLDKAPEIQEEEQEEDLIPFMKAEISAALAGIEESSYLRGIIREFLRYGSSQPNSTTLSLPQITDTSTLEAPSDSEPAHAIIRQGAGEIHTLVPLRSDATGGDSEKGMLPLSLKAEDADKDMKTRLLPKSGERVKRSQRDISQLKSMRVGKYSFERIVI